MNSSAPDPLEPPAPPEAVAAPPVSTEPAPSSQPRQRNKSPVVELVKIVAGGIAGCAIALVILWYGFGVDLLGLTSKSPEPPDGLVTTQKPKPDQPPSPATPPAKAKRAKSQVPNAETEIPALPDPFERPVAPPSKEIKSEPDAAPKPETQIALLDPPKPDDPNDESEPVAESDPPAKPKAKASRPEPFAVEGQRHSVPDEDNQKAIREQVKEIFKDEYQAATTPEKRLALARALRNQASKVENDPAARFVVLREAYDHALAAGDHNLAEETASELAAAYDVDLLSIMAHLVTIAARTAHSDDARREVVSRALEVVNQLADAKRFDEAGKVAAAVESLAIRLRDIELRKRLRSTIEHIETQHRAWLAVERAMEKLKGDPNDPLANSIYGKYICLSEGNWAKGLAMLARCKDAQLAAAAKLDIAGATEADKQLAIGNAWYDIAGADKSADGFYARAYHWYDLAVPRLVGLDKIKAERRLEELSERGPYDIARKIPVEPKKWRTTQTGSPLIAGIWNESPGIFFAISQQNGLFTAVTTFRRPNGDIRAEVVGQVTPDGRLTARLEHTRTPTPGWKSQTRTAILSPDGKTIRGRSDWDGGGGRDFIWALQQPMEERPRESTWRTTEAGYPLIAGVWQQAAPHRRITFSQRNAQFTATLAYQHEKAGEIRWQAEGKITRDGQIAARLVHTKAPSTFKDQTRIALLSPDGKTMRGQAILDGGGHGDFVWTLHTPEKPNLPIQITPPNASSQVATTQAGYPSIAGEWLEANAVRVVISQEVDQFTAVCVYQKPNFGEIRWECKGTISKDGRVKAALVHTQAPDTYFKHVPRIGQLSPNGKTIQGRTHRPDGEREFIWSRQ